MGREIRPFTELIVYSVFFNILKRIIEFPYRFVGNPRKQMRVFVQCKRYGAMTKKLLHKFWASSHCQVEACTAVPKIMERNNREILQFPVFW